METTNGIAKRTRASGPKVRTGCLTCKSRHVKCDERKPSCHRCTSTGRKCQGYLNPVHRRSTSDGGSSTTQEAMSPTFGNQMKHYVVGSPSEVRAIELFFLRAAPQLSGYFQAAFWKIALQSSFDEPAILHALIAVSAEYENDCFAEISPISGTTALKKLSLEYYNRAIRSMLKKLDGRDSILTPVMGCVIFVCLEFLRRDLAAATKHIDGGIQMIKQWRARRAKQGVEPQDKLDGEAELVERLIAPMFGFLNIQTGVFGRRSKDFYSRNGGPHPTALTTGLMSGVEDVIVSLLDLLSAALKWTQHVAHLKYTSQLGIDEFMEQARLLRLMDQWKSNLDTLERERSSHWSPGVRQGLNMLKANYISVRMIVVVKHSPYESPWDALKEDFEEILRLSEELIDDANRFPDEQSKRFSFELGIIPPLSLLGGRCRYPSLRRRALALLSKSPRRECLYDTRYVVALQERVMLVEEAALKLPPGTIPRDDQLPPENARIHQTYFSWVSPNISDVWEVDFFTRPDGPQGRWNVSTELIRVDKTMFYEQFSLNEHQDEIPQPEVGCIPDFWINSMASSVPTAMPAMAHA